MTPKEEAEKLVDKHLMILANVWDSLRTKKDMAKQCALVCVNRMLEFAYDIEWEKKEDALSKIKFLKEVKQEINKL
mgnify:CR=1 FL=1